MDRGAATPALPPALPPGRASQGGNVTLNFTDTDIREVARVILGTTLKLDYTIDPKVQGTATLDTGTPLARSALLPTLETLLNQNGATLIERNGLYEVVPISTAAVTNTLTGANVPGAGAQVIVLRYASAADLAKVLQPYAAEGSKIAADPGRNALIISGDAAARESLAGLIEAFDVDMLAGQSFALFTVKEGDVTSETAAVEKALRAEQGGAAGGIVRVVPLPRVNAVLVASAQPRYLDAARRFFRLAGRVEDATARTWHVYYVQNGRSAELENLLQRAFTPGHVTATATSPGGTAPGAQSVRLASQSAFQTGSASGNGTGGPVAGNTTSGMPAPSQQQAPTPGGAPLPGGAPPAPGGGPPPSTEPLSAPTEGEGNATEQRIRILSDQRNNALLIYATPSEFSVIDAMLRKIDMIPLQVLIDATIAEVDLNDTLQYGTQFFFTLAHVAQTLGNPPSAPFPSPALAPSGLVGFALTKSPNFILQALADVTKVKVLSAPQVMVMDNQPAHLEVGQQVPILTGTATSTLTTGAPIVNSVDYHPTGVIMQVTPRISSGGLISLDIAQEVSDVAAAAVNTVTGSPTFDDRIVQTHIAVQDGQTVALAGLIRDTTSDDNNGFPFMKDIPVLSTLFSSQLSTRNRTELLVLITPHVVHDQRDAYALTEDLRSQLSGAALVKPELSRRPVPGLANPNGL